jgi:hypothetical protein
MRFIDSQMREDRVERCLGDWRRRETGSPCSMATECQFGKAKFWGEMVVMVAQQCEYT